jgi:hypothetical protein
MHVESLCNSGISVYIVYAYPSLLFLSSASFSLLSADPSEYTNAEVGDGGGDLDEKCMFCATLSLFLLFMLFMEFFFSQYFSSSLFVREKKKKKKKNHTHTRLVSRVSRDTQGN